MHGCCWTGPAVLTVFSGAATDVGRVREVNEDSVHVGQRVFVVADGMGGHAAGDVASRLSVEVMADLDEGALTVERVREAVARANLVVREHARAHPESEGLGTTVAGLAVLDGSVPHWAVFHVGDSRVHLFRDGVLHQLTVDHSEVQELIEQGRISVAEAATHPSRHIITRAIGEPEAPEVELIVLPVRTGGRFLLCTDGLTNELTDGDLVAVLAANHPPQETAEILVRRACENGGSDNVTVIVVDEPVAGEAQPVAGATNPRSRV